MKRLKIMLLMALAMVSQPVMAGIWGKPKFVMEQSDDRFSTDGLTTWSSNGNRISQRSIAGGRHIDAKGVFFDPFVFVRRTDGAVMKIGFHFHNYAWRDTISGSPLSIGVPQRATFLTNDGEPIAIEITMSRVESSETPDCSGAILNCQWDLHETGMLDLSQEQYLRIVNASTLAVKIEGSKRSFVYEAKDVDPTFFANLKSFYQSHMAK